jgi:glycosyltransferase involved in cell wall biosynthesis
MSDGAEQPQDPFVVACVPAFNEEGSIAGVVVQAGKYVDRVVVCDDGSVDLTGEIVEGLWAVVVTLDGDG